LLVDQFPVDRPGQDMLQARIGLGLPSGGAIEALPTDVLQPRQELEAEPDLNSDST
jgi:hypothetical protein